MYFLIFQPDDMLNLCLNFNESQPICAYKRYPYKKSVCSPFWPFYDKVTGIKCMYRM